MKLSRLFIEISFIPRGKQFSLSSLKQFSEAPFTRFFIVSLLLTHIAVLACQAGFQGRQTTVVFESGKDGYHTYRIPAAITTVRGTILAFCEGRKDGQGDAGRIDLVCRRSEDNGRTWTPTQVVWSDQNNTCGNPCPVVDRKTGTIWLLATHNLGRDREGDIIRGTSVGTRTIWVMSSHDDGRSWSLPRNITQKVKPSDWTWYATGPGAGIQLVGGSNAGRLVIPCDHIEARTKKYYSHIIYSDDGGKNWQLGGSTPQDKVNECEVVELADGRLMLNMRNYDRSHKSRAVSFSRDGGLTWSTIGHDNTLVEPICQASIRAMGPGSRQILFSNPASSDSRKNMTVRMSGDDGKTWMTARSLYKGPAAYSCLTILADGSAACLYERGKTNPYETIVLDRFDLDWLRGPSPAKP